MIYQVLSNMVALGILITMRDDFEIACAPETALRALDISTALKKPLFCSFNTITFSLN